MNCLRGHEITSGYPCTLCVAARTRARKYGITIDQALSIPELCECCLRRTTLYLDHDHETGLFRGWLCHDCNAGLGRFHDDTELLQLAIFYLQEKRETA